MSQAANPNIIEYFGSYRKDDELFVSIFPTSSYSSSLLSFCFSRLSAPSTSFVSFWLVLVTLHRSFSSRFLEPLIQIAMEFCDGGSAADMYLALDAPLKEVEIKAIVNETMKGLDYLHHLGFIHRDIKGGNILINKKGQVKLSL